MPYCQNCGAEVAGNFCPNCGAQLGDVVSNNPQPIIHKNVTIKGRYSTFAIALAGWLGLGFLISTVVMLFCGVLMDGITFGERMIFVVAGAVCAGLTYLCYLPGIHSIRKYSPDGEVMSTFGSFFGRSLLFFFAWGISIMSLFFIIGILFRFYRFGLWASRPRDDQYTVIVDGKLIPVTRYYDDLPDFGPKGTWVYMDENGEFYRPAL